MSRPATIADLLSATFHGTPVEKRLKEGRIWLIWNSAVGPQIAAKARPVGFRDGVLTVAVVSSPWMQQLAFLKKEITEKLNTLLGEELVREIFLKAGRPKAVVPPQPVSESKPQLKLTDEESHRIGAQTATISDPGLRESFARLMAKHFSTGTQASPPSP